MVYSVEKMMKKQIGEGLAFKIDRAGWSEHQIRQYIQRRCNTPLSREAANDFLVGRGWEALPPIDLKEKG